MKNLQGQQSHLENFPKGRFYLYKYSPFKYLHCLSPVVTHPILCPNFYQMYLTESKNRKIRVSNSNIRKNLNLKNTPPRPWLNIWKPSIVAPQSVQIFMDYAHSKTTSWKLKTKSEQLLTKILQIKVRNLTPSPIFHLQKNSNNNEVPRDTPYSSPSYKTKIPLSLDFHLIKVFFLNSSNLCSHSFNANICPVMSHLYPQVLSQLVYLLHILFVL